MWIPKFLRKKAPEVKQEPINSQEALKAVLIEAVVAMKDSDNIIKEAALKELYRKRDNHVVSELNSFKEDTYSFIKSMKQDFNDAAARELARQKEIEQAVMDIKAGRIYEY